MVMNSFWAISIRSSSSGCKSHNFEFSFVNSHGGKIIVCLVELFMLELFVLLWFVIIALKH